MERSHTVRTVVSRRLGWISLLLIAFATSPALLGEFVTDDHFTLERLALVPFTEQLRQSWFGSFSESYAVEGLGSGGLDLYRPIPGTVEAIELAAFGLDPFALHAVPWLLHLLTCGLLFVYASHALGSSGAAMLTTLIVGVSPTPSEAYIWANDIPDMVMAPFALAALLLLHVQPSGQTRARLWVSSLCLLIALLSKETACLVAPFLAVRPRLPSDPDGTPSFRLQPPRALAAIGAAVFVYAGMRLLALQGARIASSKEHVVEALSYVPLIVVDGFTSLLAPRHIALRWLLEDYGAVSKAGYIVALLALVGLGLLLFRFRNRLPLLCWGVVAATVFLAPASLAIALGWWGFGRYLYLPALFLMPGLVDAAARLVGRFSLSARIARMLGLAYVVALTVILEVTIPAWHDDEAHFLAAIDEFPNRSHGWGGLGTLYLGRGNVDAGIRLLERAVEINDRTFRWMRPLVDGYVAANNCDRALATAQKIERDFPGRALPWRSTARCRVASGDLGGALKDLLRGLVREPEDEGLWSSIRELIHGPHASVVRPALLRWADDNPSFPSLDRLLRELR